MYIKFMAPCKTFICVISFVNNDGDCGMEVYIW